ncbi:MAG: IS1096 element passenger TnpR family protein [Bacteroidales bacterium]
MTAYRFRVLFEEQEDFLRDIEIKPGQTFKDFHDVILKSVEIEGKELASFFICDPRWNKQREITLIDMGLKEPDPEFDDDDDRKPVNIPIPVAIMEDVKIKEVIDDPHQRILFEYDFLNPRVFFIELMKIVDTDPKKEYPVCVKKEGTLTPTIAPNYLSFLDDPDEDAMLGELDKMILDGDLEEEIDENYTTEPEW